MELVVNLIFCDGIFGVIKTEVLATMLVTLKSGAPRGSCSSCQKISSNWIDTIEQETIETKQ